MPTASDDRWNRDLESLIVKSRMMLTSKLKTKWAIKPSKINLLNSYTFGVSPLPKFLCGNIWRDSFCWAEPSKIILTLVVVISGLTTGKCERNHSVCGFGHLLGFLGYILYSSCLQPLTGKSESLCEGALPPFLGLAVFLVFHVSKSQQLLCLSQPNLIFSIT